MVFLVVGSLTVQKVVSAMIVLGSLLASPWLISELLGGNIIPLIFLAGGAFLIFFLSVLGDKCWLIVPFCLPMSGSLNCLPVKFSPSELAVLLVISYVFIRFVFTSRRSLYFGPPQLWFPLLIIFFILLYHTIISGGVGLNMFGGESAGSRKVFSIFISFLALPAILWFPPVGKEWLHRIPLLFFLGSLAEFFPYTISSIAPSLAPFIFKIYSNVNFDTYAATLALSGSEEVIGRIVVLGSLSLGIQSVLLAYFPPRDWLRPSRWFVPILSMTSLFASIFSGYRSNLFNFLLLSFFAFLFRLRAIALLFLPALALFVVILCAGQGTAFTLPLSVQRTLSPFPGRWDARVVQNAGSSDDFRKLIADIYVDETMQKSGLLGLGYKYSAKYMQDRGSSFADMYHLVSKEDSIRGYIEARDHHVGWVAVHHPIGWLGFACFVIFCACTLGYCLLHILRIPVSLVTPLQVWACSLITMNIFSFFSVFGALNLFFPQVMPLLAISIISFRESRYNDSPSPSLGGNKDSGLPRLVPAGVA